MLLVHVCPGGSAGCNWDKADPGGDHAGNRHCSGLQDLCGGFTPQSVPLLEFCTFPGCSSCIVSSVQRVGNQVSTSGEGQYGLFSWSTSNPRDVNMTGILLPTWERTTVISRSKRRSWPVRSSRPVCFISAMKLNLTLCVPKLFSCILIFNAWSGMVGQKPTSGPETAGSGY